MFHFIYFAGFNKGTKMASHHGSLDIFSGALVCTTE